MLTVIVTILLKGYVLSGHVILKCCAYNDIRTDLFTSARSIHPNFDNLTHDDDKLSLILAINADMISNIAKACHQILSKKKLSVQIILNFYITFYQLYHIFILTINDNVSHSNI